MGIASKYDIEPVHYCSRCLSLAIIKVGEDYCYCKECHSATLDECNIYEWEDKYIAKYGIRYLYKRRNK